MARKRRGAPKRAPRPAAHRREVLNTTGELLKLIFGHFAESHPALWELQAFLAIVASVFERLTSTKDPLPLDELADLAKVLADARRNRNPADRAALRTIPGVPTLALPESADPATGDAPLPTTMARVVQRIYGAGVSQTSANDVQTITPATEMTNDPPELSKEELHPSNVEPQPSNTEPVASVNEAQRPNDKSELLTDESDRTFDSPEMATEPP